ncbi:MAG TPA: ATP-binding protein [Noviherbaspirillum sp.]|nr:ATP-binding protein [Noviherbaspirillum sp.]
MQGAVEQAELEIYRRVFYVSPNFVSISRLTDGTYIDVNPAFERFTGRSREEVIGRTSFDIALFPYPEERAEFARVIAPLGEVHGYLAHMYDHNREIRDVDVSANIIMMDGEPVLVAIVRDVTEHNRAESELTSYRDQLEQLVAQRTAELQNANLELRRTNRELAEAHNQLLQSEKMASIGQLAAGVAHEINNPVGFVNSNLSTLIDYVQRLLQVIDAYEKSESVLAQAPDALDAVRALRKQVDLDYVKEDVFSLLSESQEGVLRVKNIVQDLKDFSHVGTAEWQLADLHAGLNSTLNIVNNEIKYKATVVKEYGELPPVECLPLELNQVFMNLLVNAAHAIERFGEITVRTGWEGGEVWIDIGDNGSGIAPENLGRIFDPFFTTKPVGKGTGLGLSLSYSIVQKHHGRIDVDSELGRGTRFRVWLPVTQSALAA